MLDNTLNRLSSCFPGKSSLYFSHLLRGSESTVRLCERGLCVLKATEPSGCSGAVMNSCLLWTSAPSQGFWAKLNVGLCENRPRGGRSQQRLPLPAPQEVQLEGPLPWHPWQLWWHRWHCFLSSNFHEGQFKMQWPSSKTLEEKQIIRVHLGDFSEGAKDQNTWYACFALQIWSQCPKEWCLGLVISGHVRY